MTEDLIKLAAEEISRRVSTGEATAEAVVRAHLERVGALDGGIRAFLLVLKERAIERARSIDARRAAGRTLGRLAGVPVAVKDNILVGGCETTCASKILKGYVAPYDATVVERLEKEDAVIIGKTNMDEFAMGSSTENSAFFPTANPWDKARVPGGSSGGSAAALAARFCSAALGSDTGGSIRQPAAFCGVVGLKPTYGLVSRYGLVAFASSLDQIGPMTRTVKDAALVLSVIGGHDPRDSTSAPQSSEEALAGFEGTVKGLKVGLPQEYFADGLDQEARDAIAKAVEALKSRGARVSEISLPHTKYAISTYYIIAPSEASSNLARYDGVRYGHRSSNAANLDDLYELSRGEGFGPEVKRRIMLGTYALSSGYYDAYYGKAQRVRTLIRRDFEEAFQKVDILLTPTSPTPAFRMGEKTGDPLTMYLSDIFTIPSNMAGNTSLSLPCALTQRGLPIGLQLVAPPFQEGLLLRTAAVLEEALAFPGLNLN